MEEALKSRPSSHRPSATLSSRQLADSIPVRDEEDRNPSRVAVKSPEPTSSTQSITVPLTSGRSGVAMSIPAILKQNVPGFKARNARMAQLQSTSKSAANDKLEEAHEKARQKLGRRAQRRWENAHFYGSKYMVPPRASDYSPAQLSTAPIFPSPPPSTFFPYKPSADPTADPNARPAPTFDDSVASADHGRFSLPMKGLKRNTRRIVAEGGIGGQIVDAVDLELRAWLEGTEVWLSPETIAYNNAHNLNSGKRCICEVDTDHGRMQAVSQLAKQPHALVWQSEDSFTRFLIHAIARYYRVVSFTKTDPTTSSHLIWLLRPSMAPKVSQDPASKPKSGFDTPPTTASEWEASSMGGLTTSASELESIASGSGVDMLSADEEASAEELDDTELGEQDGDVTIIELEMDDAILVNRAETQSRRRPIQARMPARLRGSRPAIGRTLSDIDSGAEVDDEREIEGDQEDTLGDSVASLSLASPAGVQSMRTSRAHPSTSTRTSREQEESLSRGFSPVRPYRRTAIQASGPLASKGWKLPPMRFADWVLAS